MRIVGSVAAVVLAVVFVWAAASKLARPARAAAAWHDLGLPAPGLLAAAVPATELACAVALLAVPRAGSLAAIGLLALFTGVVVGLLRTGAPTGCGCFGRTSANPVSGRDVARNVALLAMAGLAVFAR